MLRSTETETEAAEPEVTLPDATLSENGSVASAPETPKSTPAVAPVDAVPVQASGPRIELSLTGPCWVEIRAIDGSYKLLGEFQAGTRRVLGGSPPYKILLGNASVASLTIDGQPIDLKPHTSKQIARLVLDPSER
jgi:cytoskeleton protein RodZ